MTASERPNVGPDSDFGSAGPTSSSNEQIMREALERIAAYEGNTHKRVWVAADIAKKALDKIGPSDPTGRTEEEGRADA